MEGKGWILLHRKIIDHPFYRERRKFPITRRGLTFDSANYQDHEFLLGRKMVRARRGEVITSELTLMERWRWSKGKVRWFLNTLKKDRSIDRRADRKKTTILILNYDAYQNSHTQNKPLNSIDNQSPIVHNQRSNKEVKEFKEEDTHIGGQASLSPESIHPLADIWNEVCVPPLSNVLSVVGRRKNAAQARLKERPDLEEWRGIFQRYRQHSVSARRKQRRLEGRFRLGPQAG